MLDLCPSTEAERQEDIRVGTKPHHTPFVPTTNHIAKEAAKIRSTWDASEERRRRANCPGQKGFTIDELRAHDAVATPTIRLGEVLLS